MATPTVPSPSGTWWESEVSRPTPLTSTAGGWRFLANSHPLPSCFTNDTEVEKDGHPVNATSRASAEQKALAISCHDLKVKPKTVNPTSLWILWVNWSTIIPVGCNGVSPVVAAYAHSVPLFLTTNEMMFGKPYWQAQYDIVIDLLYLTYSPPFTACWFLQSKVDYWNVPIVTPHWYTTMFHWFLSTMLLNLQAMTRWFRRSQHCCLSPQNVDQLSHSKL